ncbi:hypothetical protein [Nostoc sp. TCL26-01]|uniref:hypothetical protein n=1 Tax=Nostoc sp. TCL26-01 TaxID=2576904 RepID=UPI0015B9D729|nr:hypothetical protein [Nostoc sp. TCL26-01]QLE55445.1 hypothetical protein FD725_07900 [Nostoc sp. TCL26-01]
MALFEAPAAHETQYSHLYINPGFVDEWEMPEATQYSHPYTNPELEADQFFFLAPLALKIGAKIAGKLALKGAKKLALKGAKKMISRAPKVLKKIQQVRNKIEQVRSNLPQQNSVRRSPPQSQAPPWLQRASRLVRPLGNVLRTGESEAEALEAEFFGSNEFEGELANHTAAHEIALTELLATEAARTENAGEAEVLLSKALPITIRIMSGGKMLRQATPSLMQANRHLVRSLHRQGQEGRQFLRVGSAIHRRTIASLRVIRASGGQITPELVSQLMAAHTERVLGTPSILGRALIRNFAIRRSTSIPVKALI